jgi:hypothetical protein
VIAFPEGSAREIVQDGLNGYLVDDEDSMAARHQRTSTRLIRPPVGTRLRPDSVLKPSWMDTSRSTSKLLVHDRGYLIRREKGPVICEDLSGNTCLTIEMGLAIEMRFRDEGLNLSGRGVRKC